MGLRNVNKRIAIWVTEKVGTMWCAHAFCVLALISLPEALASQDPLKIVSWTAQTFLQWCFYPSSLLGKIFRVALPRGKQIQTAKRSLRSSNLRKKFMRTLTSQVQHYLVQMTNRPVSRCSCGLIKPMLRGQIQRDEPSMDPRALALLSSPNSGRALHETETAGEGCGPWLLGDEPVWCCLSSLRQDVVL